MNEEELRAQIVKLEEDKNNLIQENEFLKNNITEHKQINEELQQNITDLKLKNYELFTQLTTAVPQQVETKNDTNIISLNELTKNLMKGN